MPTYTPIQSITLTESMSSVTISNIPQNYADLIISIASSSTHTVNDDIQFRFNGDTGSNYSQVRLFTVNEISTGASDRQTSSTYIGGAWQPATNSTSGSVGITYSQIFNYSSTTMNKTVFNTMDLYSFKAVVGKTCGVWRNTSAINSVTLFSQYGAKIAAGSIINVYGISSAASNNAQAFGGTDIFYDSSYVYHVFKASGTFTPIRNLTADYLVVAGGGGGGNAFSNGSDGGGGGGAGGLRSTVGATGGGGTLESALSLTANTTYTVTVGAGGSGGTTDNRGSNGSNSIFSTITSTGGGGGGGIAAGQQTGANGGSGGGAGCYAVSGGSGTSGQGYAGGTGASNGTAGGGGAGAVGSNGSTNSTNGGNGGIGVQITAFATPTNTGVNSGYYAGGGGGAADAGGGTAGLGGSGGGGIGFTPTYLAGSGITNTGSGGGGGSAVDAYAVGGNGGSGIVIVRYAR